MSDLLLKVKYFYLQLPEEIQEWMEPNWSYYCCGPMGKSAKDDDNNLYF